MNKANLDRLFQNYIDHFDELNNSEHNEKYKWDAVEQVQKYWDLSADDIADMIKRSFSLSYNLINNRIVQPVSGLIAVARIEPEPVRSALTTLLADTDDVDKKQDQILNYVDAINDLLEKHFSGKWKYVQDARAVICYLAMIKPAQNYMFKSIPAHYFARYMEYSNDIGSGQTFKLRQYYAMCDELVECIKAAPAIMEIDSERHTAWKDSSYHVLAYDLIYCLVVYNLINGMKEPVPTSKSSNRQQQAYRMQQAAALQTEIEGLQGRMDTLQQQIDSFPEYQFEGMTMRTKAFGTVTITKQNGQYIFFTAFDKERQFVLPGCISNGFLIPENTAILERYQSEATLKKQLESLDTQQRMKSRELDQYQ